jgi:hypothetical protein
MGVGWSVRERVLVALLAVAVLAVLCLAAALANACSSELRDMAAPRQPPSPPPCADPDECLLDEEWP